MLREAHVLPLTRYVERLRVAHPSSEFPDFDPFDGGADADLLFLFEKPGPMTSATGKGSGFISRNNDDQTAAATFAFMEEAGIPRARTVTWNIVPGWNGTIGVSSAELLEGVSALKDLLPLLPNLQTIILVGRKAERAEPLIKSLGIRILISAHPAPRVRAAYPDMWRRIPQVWAQALSRQDV